MRIIAFFAVLAFALTACGGTEQGVEPGEQTPVPPTAQLSSECTNQEVGYRIRYPADWFTNEGDVVPACAVFHDERVELEPGTEIPFTMSVSIRASDAPFDEITAEDQERPELDISNREETTVDGHDAVVVTGEGTGAALLPDGMPIYRYTIDLEDGVLIASTYGVGDPDEFRQKQRILDQMMASLEFTT